MNLQKVIETDFSIFEKFNEENKSKAIEATRHLISLAQEENVDLNAVDLITCIGTGEGNQIITNRNQINLKFHTYIQNIGTTGGLTLDEIAKINHECDEVNRRIIENKKASIKNTMTQIRTNIEQYRDRIQAEMGGMNRAKRELEVLRIERPTNYAKLVETIVQGKFFKLKDVSHVDQQVCLNFLTPDLSWELDSDGGTAKFGQFVVNFNVVNGAFKLLPFKNNSKGAYGNIFPYVSSENNICWGNFDSQVAENIQAGRIEDNFLILRSILQQETHGSPYYDSMWWNPYTNANQEMFENRDYEYLDAGSDSVPQRVVHTACEISYLDGYATMMAFLPRNQNERNHMRDLIRGNRERYWEDNSGEFEDSRFTRKAILYAYKTYVHGKHGGNSEIWDNWASRNQSHPDVTLEA